MSFHTNCTPSHLINSLFLTISLLFLNLPSTADHLYFTIIVLSVYQIHQSLTNISSVLTSINIPSISQFLLHVRLSCFMTFFFWPYLMAVTSCQILLSVPTFMPNLILFQVLKGLPYNWLLLIPKNELNVTSSELFLTPQSKSILSPLISSFHLLPFIHLSLQHYLQIHNSPIISFLLTGIFPLYLNIWVDGGLVTKLCPNLETPWTIAHQAPLSVSTI